MESGDHLWGELLILILLILGNGVCSMTEIAIVSARKTRLKEMAEKGDRGARAAIHIAENPAQLFSTIQIGITAIGIITGMFSGSSLAGPLAEELKKNTCRSAICIGTGDVDRHVSGDVSVADCRRTGSEVAGH